MPASVLFIENQDSFSWNVIDALPVERQDVIVRSGSEVARSPALLDGMDAVVLGPGPMDPVRAGIVDLVREIARRELPLLGVCLGCQAIGLAFGARLVRNTPAHGQQSVATFHGSRLFPGFAGPSTVMRYHSLSLAEVPAPLRVTALTEDGIVMTVEHERLPLAGVQFHPDSYATPRGAELLAAFFGSVA